MYRPQASMVVYDIPDPKNGLNLGSVVFSESFLESSICIQQRGKNLICDGVLLLMLKTAHVTLTGISYPADGALSSDNGFTVLTKSVPRHVCWLVGLY